MKKIRVICLFLCVAVLFSIVITPQENIEALTELEKAQKQKNEIENKISNIKSKINEEKKKLDESKSEVEKLKIKASIEEKEKEELAAKLLLLYNEIDTLDQLIKEAEAEYEKKEAEFYEKARMMYVYSQKSAIQILAESESVADFFRRVNLLLLIANSDKNMLEELVQQKQEIEYKKSMKSENAKEVDRLISQKELNLKKIELTKSELENAIKKTSQSVKTLQNEEQALKKETEEIQKMIRQLQEKKNKEGTQTKYVGGVMVWPVPSSSRISSPYGRRWHPIWGYSEFHTGIDIPAPTGNSILAAQSGEVIFSGRKGGYGNCVIIDHGGGITTLYGHASKLLVKTGQQVKKGQVIAKIGSTGWSTGPHLHFQVMKNGNHTDPMPYLTSK